MSVIILLMDKKRVPVDRRRKLCILTCLSFTVHVYMCTVCICVANFNNT